MDQPTLQFQQKQCVNERDNLPVSTYIEQAGGSGSSDLHFDPDIELTNIYSVDYLNITILMLTYAW